MKSSLFTLFALAAMESSLLAKEIDPTFNRDVAPILYANCTSCHRPGQAAPFPLLSYGDAKKRGRLIAQTTQSKQMPPWKAEKGDVAFRNERRLTEADIATIKKWFDTGMPEGDPDKAPTPPVFAAEWTLGPPDLVVKMPKAFHVPAEGRDIYRNFAIPLNLPEDKWIKAIDFRPSAPAVVHHSLFFLDPTGETSKRELASGQVGLSGSMSGVGGQDKKGSLGALGGLSALAGNTGTEGMKGIGGWALGAQARALPDGLAYRVTKGSDIVLSTHFHTSGKAEDEASTIALYFTDKAPVQRFTSVQVPFGFGILAGIDIPAGKTGFTIQDSYVLPIDVKAFGVSAHAHYIAKSFNLTATLPDGGAKTLLKITDWDFGWQEQYAFKDFVDLPKGTKLDVRISYDNSADNPRNPTSPPRRVRWGKESTDEMGSMTLQVVAAKESEFPQLREAYQQYVRDSAIKGALKKIGDR